MAKIRVYELAKELGKDTKEMVKIIRSYGFVIKGYMSTLTEEEAEQVRRKVRGGATTPAVAEKPKKRAPTVIRRRANRSRPAVREAQAEAEAQAREAEQAAAQQAVQAQPAGRPVVRRARVINDSEQSSAPQSEAPSAASASAGESKPRAAAQAETESVPEPERVKPAVGTRIQLPAGTRRLPGGMRERMAQQPARPTRAPEPERPKVVEAKAKEPEPEPAVEAKPEPKPQEDRDEGRRVVRNDAGVIVGAAPQRSEPKIVGFIKLERRRPQQVIITDASEESRGGRASQRKQREERAQAQGRRRKMTMRGRGRDRSTGPRVTTQEMSEAKKRIRVDEVIQISDLAHQMGKKASAALRVLWGMGLRGLTINSSIDAETAEVVAGEFGYTVENVSFQEEEFLDDFGEVDGEPRAPVVTIMGHVDHGKTSLLDKIRSSTLVEGESGGITQHIGAYKVETDKGDVVFLDTPGHEAFSAMRSRGAQITDVVVLVVAADDGVMPTTVEAIKHAQEADTPILVAINKIDKPDANPGRVKQALMEYALVGEEFGGETIICEVSAKKGTGIDKLLEMLALQAELLELTASREGRAQGTVLEARVDKGRGPIATLLVDAGTLKKGDMLVANEFSGKVRAIFNDRGKKLKEVGPSTPVEVLGLDGAPQAGDRFAVVENEKAARQLVAHRREVRRRKESVRTGPSIHDLIARKKIPTLKIVLRADVQGSAEALKQALLELSTEKVTVEVIFSGVGAITQTDVKMASAGEAVIIGFSTKPVGKAGQVAEHENVPIFVFDVIYDALDKVRELMIGQLEPEYREKELGEAEVRALFPIPRLGVVAGCRVIKGMVRRNGGIRVVREGRVLHKGSVQSLRIFKEDVKEVRDGFECGIVVEGFGDVQPGDILQSFEIETIAPTL
jgi:translation initiation factor IF-2